MMRLFFGLLAACLLNNLSRRRCLANPMKAAIL